MPPLGNRGVLRPSELAKAVARQAKLAGPPLVPRAKAQTPKPTRVTATQTAHGTTAKLTGGIPTPLAGAPALAKAYKDTPTPAPSHGSGHSLFSLHTLESGASDVADALAGAVKAGGKDAYGIGDKRGTRAQIEAGKGAPGAAVATTINSRRFAAALPVMAKNLPGSTARLATGILPGIYDTGKAGVQALEGKPAALEAVGKGLADMALHPLKYAEKEPASALLMAAGAEAGAGTAAGEAMRSGALGDKAAQIASTARPALELYNDMAIPREYSKDVIRKGAQVAADQFREKVLKDPNVNLATGTRLNRHIYGGGLLGQSLERAGVPYAQGFFKPGMVDKVEGASKAIRRMYTNAANGHMARIQAPLVKGAEQAVPLAVEGTIRTAKTAKADLESRLASLKTEAKALTGREAALNKAQQEQITTLLANKQFIADPKPVIQAAKEFGDHQQPIVDRKVQLGALEPDQVHAKYVPYATQHMGATYNVDPGAHPLVRQISDLNKATKASERRVAQAQAARDNAAAPNPRVPSNHPVALAQTAVRRAEADTARAEGRSTNLNFDGRSPRMLNPAKLRGDSARARAALAKAKSDLLDEHNAKLQAAKNDLLDRRGEVAKAQENLAHMKAAGMVKANGDMWPRLEVNGNPLHTEDIQAHARANLGDREIGFLTHKETSYGSATHSHSGLRPAIEQRSRTGIAYKTGTYDSSWDALKRQAYKDAQDIHGHEGRDEMVRRLGFGSYQTKEAAERAADNFNHTPEGERVTKALGEVQVVHAGPDRVLNRANMPSSVASDTMKAFGLAEHKAIAELGPEGKFRLMPKMVVDRIAEHDALNGQSKVARVSQMLTNKWRSTALYTNPRWPVGIAQENMVRLGFAGVNPFAMFKVGKAVKLGDALADQFRTIAADPAATEAQRFAARAHVAAIDSGTQYGGLIDNAVHRRVSDVLPPEAKTAMDAFNATTPVSKMLAGWDGWKIFLGNKLHKLGSNTNKALLGKVALQEAKKFSGEWKELLTRQDRAVKAYAQGKLSPAASVKLGDDILKMAGNWKTLTPAVRKMTQTIAPFDLWWLNSMKFVFQTLPVDHPFKSAALAAMASATGATEAKPKAYLDGSVGVTLPIVGDVSAEISKYSPFGIGGREWQKTAVDIFGVPQIAGLAQTAMGIDPLTHEPVTSAYAPKRSAGVSAVKALEDAVEEYVPGVRPAEAILKRGGKEDPMSMNPIATLPGTQRGLAPALVKAFAPFPFTAGPRTGGRERPVRERPIRERAARAVRERPTRER